MNARALSATALAVAPALVVLAAGCEPAPDATPKPEAKPTAAAPAATPPKPSAAPPPAQAEPPKTPAKGPFPESTDPAMRDPSKAKATAPATFKAKLETTQGDFEVECTRAWAPNGVDRFYNLVKIGFFDDVAFFRVVKTPKPFVVQFGIHGNPEVSKLWKDSQLKPDKPVESNKRGMLTYAMAGSPDTRTTQLFINLGDNVMLDKMGFAPICKVSGDGMAIIDKLDGTYGETGSRAQPDIQSQGNAFLRQRFPLLDYIKTARLVDPKAGAKPAK
jgi:peptidyl-prolyl cis-trans isomerase A (cyclophilin A)